MQQNNKRKNYGKKKTIATMTCHSCGKTLKQRKRRNYPFGKKSGARITKYYKCTACNTRY